MSVSAVEFLKEFHGNKIKVSKNNVSLQLEKGLNISGAVTIAKNLLRNNPNGLSLEDRMFAEQCLEYSQEVMNVERSGDKEKMTVILKDLNSCIKDQVYFIGQECTVADVFLYHSFYPVFEKLTFQEKEKFIHLSRWFSHIQDDDKARQSLQPLKFLRTMLYTGVSSH